MTEKEELLAQKAKIEAEIAQNTKKLQLLKEKNSNQELDLKQIQELEQKLQALEAEKKEIITQTQSSLQ